MKVVAYIELLIFVRVFLGAITFQTSILAPIFIAHFLRQRYYHSSFSREAITSTDTKIQDFVHKEGVHPIAGQVWDKIRALVGRWAGSTLGPQPQPAGGARR
jgi:hypothetical protein